MVWKIKLIHHSTLQIPIQRHHFSCFAMKYLDQVQFSFSTFHLLVILLTYICVSSETANFNLKVVLNPTAPKMGGRADLLLEMKQILRFLQERGEGERARVQRMVVIFLTSLCILDSWLGELSSNLEDIFLIWQNTNQEDHLLDLTLTFFLKRGQICCILLCTYCVIWSQKVLYCVKQ